MTPESAGAAEVEMEASYAQIRAAIEAMPEAEKAKEIKPMKPTVRAGRGGGGRGARLGQRRGWSEGGPGRVPLPQRHVDDEALPRHPCSTCSLPRPFLAPAAGGADAGRP